MQIGSVANYDSSGKNKGKILKPMFYPQKACPWD